MERPGAARWGGQLEGVRDDPVVLQQANKLVYSPHDYPNSLYPNSRFEGPNFKDNLPNVFREHWGFIYEQGIAPIFTRRVRHQAARQP